MKNARIIKVEVEAVDIPLKTTFTISLGSKKVTRNVLIRMYLDNGVVGYGESAPALAFPDENSQVIERVVNKASEKIVGMDISDYQKIIRLIREKYPEYPLSLSGIEGTIFDALTQNLGVPLYQFLGGKKKILESDVTLSLAPLDEIHASILDYLKKGFSKFKLKIGSKTLAEDYERVIKIHEILKSCKNRKIEMALDGNQWFTPDQAIKLMKRLLNKKIPLVYFEQPLKRTNYEGFKYLKKRSPLPIAVDETVINSRDALKVIKDDLADIINIKLAKCGILDGLEIVRIVKKAGKTLMIGCMTESETGLASSVHFACGTGVFEHIDLDSCFLLKAKLVGNRFKIKGPKLIV